ncbi:hypothetical protein BC827DRAFT_1224583, partial [Russula dissimulans]
MDGLEIKVQLGSVWKQSLTELSGGQRCVCHALRLRHPFPSHAYLPTHHMSFQFPNPTHMPQRNRSLIALSL